MGIIKRLDIQTINKIAAGEVVENPASVVKELVENALDAGANEITVEYLAGGLKLLRVIDNGCGMSDEDAQLAFEQHATSKITSVEDIHDIATKGFRGEALASIAAVSKVRLATSQDDHGVEVSINGGVFQGISPVARGRGTTIEVQDLFYNIPARKKFQKSPAAASTELIKTMIMLMLAHPNVHFRLMSQGRVQLEGKDPDMKTRIDEVLGKHFMQESFRVEYTEGALSLTGYIGSPRLARMNRAGQYLFVNKRGVSAYQISLAVKDGYGTRIDEKKHPLFVLFLDVPGKGVDVNVHPQKREVRFTDESFIKDFVRKGIAKSFFEKTTEYQFPKVAYQEPIFSLQETAPFDWSEETMRQPFFQEEEHIHVVGKYAHFLLIAAPFLSFDEGLVLVHLKRARKRVFFEKAHTEAMALQKLMTPEIIGETITETEAETLLAAGISARPFGEKEVVIDAVAHDLTNVREVFLSSLDVLRKGSSLAEKRESSLKLLALKHIREEWEKKTESEALALIRQLLKTKEPLICPEGKTICKGYGTSELER